MANAMNSALVRRLGDRVALVARDIGAGFMSTSRAFVTLVGCATLLAAAVITSDDGARERVVELAPTVVSHWLESAEETVAAAAAQAESEQAPALLAAELPEQRNITQYLARRYRVADGAMRQLVAAAYRFGEQHALDPMLILAVMAVESSMNPFAESAVGAQGLMQVMTSVHTEKFEAHGGSDAALDPIANIQVGATILKDLIRRGGSVERGLQLYVGAGNLPDDGRYAARVLAERARIEQAAAGKVSGAILAGLRADAARIEARAAAASAPAAVTPVSVTPASDGAPAAAPSGAAADKAA